MLNKTLFSAAVLSASVAFANSPAAKSPVKKETVTTTTTTTSQVPVAAGVDAGMTATGTAAMAGAAGTKDIVDTATAAGEFTTLQKALTQAGLVQILKGPGPYTVFAPTDAAFAKMKKSDLDALLKDNEKLKKVLLAHVVPGTFKAADVASLKDGAKVKTVGTKELTIGKKDGGVMVNDAHVVKTDVAASNGVIHAIDKVIMP